MIWCVEDDASIRDIELYALRSAGLEAEGFTDGAAFWQALQSEKPDLRIRYICPACREQEKDNVIMKEKHHER